MHADDLATLDLSPYLASSALDPVLPASVFESRLARQTRLGPGLAMAAAAARAPAPAIEPELPALGTVVGKYRLEKLLGVGGFAAVYRAKHVRLDSYVAIKLLRPSVLRARPALLRVLSDEARTAARFEHPHIVRVFDVETTGQFDYIVMEYVNGPDLSVMIKRRGALPARMVVRVLNHMVDALTTGLDLELVHRDIKPSNIILTPEGVTKLADFGLARTNAEAHGGGIRGVVGTAGYMAPEQALLPDSVDFRSDLYSLGITAYQALLGTPPFDANDAAAFAQRTREVAAPHELRPDVPRDLSELVMHMMAREPGDRPASYRAVKQALPRMT